MDKTVKSRPRLIRLILGTLMFAVAFVIVFSFSIITVTGYEFNFKDGNLQSIGMIRITSVPTDVNISVNDKQLNWWSNDKINLLSGNYKLEAAKEGYHPWKKIVPVQAGSLRWIDMRLIPVVKKIETIKSYDQLQGSFASADRRYLLNQFQKNQFELVNLSTDNPIYLSVDLNNYILDAANRDLKFNGFWGDAGLLLFNDVRSTNRDLFIVNPKIHSETRNLSLELLASDIEISRHKAVYGDNKSMMVLSKTGNLYLVGLQSSLTIELIAERVDDFYSVAKGIVVFTQNSLSPDTYGQKMIIINDFGTKKMIEMDRSPIGQKISLRADYSSYSHNQRLAYQVEKQLRVFEGNLISLRPPELTPDDELLTINESANINQVLSRFKTANPGFLPLYSKVFSDATVGLDLVNKGRFLLIDQGLGVIDTDYNQLAIDLNRIKGVSEPIGSMPITTPTGKLSQRLVIDLNYLQEYMVAVNLTSGSRQVDQPLEAIKWLDDIVMWENIAQVIRIKDYDGQNQHKLIPAMVEYDVLLSNNNKYLYYYNKSNDGAKIELRRLKLL